MATMRVAHLVLSAALLAIASAEDGQINLQAVNEDGTLDSTPTELELGVTFSDGPPTTEDYHNAPIEPPAAPPPKNTADEITQMLEEEGRKLREAEEAGATGSDAAADEGQGAATGETDGWTRMKTSKDNDFQPRLEWKKVFADLDTDNDGILTSEEVVGRFTKLAAHQVKNDAVDDAGASDDESDDVSLNGLSKEDAAKFAEETQQVEEERFAEVDTDKSGALEWPEMEKYVVGDPDESQWSEDEIKRETARTASIVKVEKLRFGAIDADKSGGLNLAEFMVFHTTTLPELDVMMYAEMMRHDVAQAFNEGDENEDGTLDKAEFSSQHELGFLEGFIDVTHPEHLDLHDL